MSPPLGNGSDFPCARAAHRWHGETGIYVVLIPVIFLLVAPVAQGGMLVGPGADWTHYKGRSTPPMQGSVSWKDPGYNDSGVFGSPRPEPCYYGYYTHYPGTEITDMRNSYYSLFLRHVFVVDDPPAIGILTMTVDYDDGFVAYLNGIEIARRNMPDGPITHSTAALVPHEASCGAGSADPQEAEHIAIDPALLVPGQNTLAVSVHNVSLSSSDIFISVQLSEGINLIRGPFLQLPEPDGVTVAWSTDALVGGSVDWGSDPSCADGTVDTAAPARRHTAHLPLPHDGRDYHYRVRSGNVVLADGVALRAPRAADQRWRAVVYGDFGTHVSPTRTLGLAVHAVNPDLQLTVGDNNQRDGAPGDYDPQWFRPFAEVMRYAPIMPALGNHDWPAREGFWMQEYFTLPQNGPAEPAGLLEKNYSFDYGSVHFAFIDTEYFEKNRTAEMAAIRDWLRDDLAATDKPWKIVILHRPPHTSLGNHGPQQRVREYICPVIEEAGVQIVFQGHNHLYERSQPINGVRYLTVGGTTVSTYPIKERQIASAFLKNDSSFLGRFEMEGPLFDFEMRSWEGTFIDRLYLNLADPFRMDGALDDDVPIRSSAGGRLHAAIKGHKLYVATRDAAYGNDHFLYVSRQPGAMRAANWAKAGSIAAWDAFLADENDNGFARWFNANEGIIDDVVAFQAVTPGVPKNGVPNDGVLEGIIDMRVLWGGIPETIHLAAAAYGNSNGGALIASSQAPAGNGNGNIEASEYLALTARSLALDLPVAVARASQESAEPGDRFTLDASASENPSGLPLSHEWKQISGPTCIIGLTEVEQPVVRVTGNPSEQETAVFELIVNDTRFDSDPVTVEVEILPRNFSFDVDSDGDGQSDAAEILAGTDPFDPASVFRVQSVGFDAQDGGYAISWASVPGITYQVSFRDQLTQGPWQPLGDPVTATQETMSVLDPDAPEIPQRFYRIVVVP